MKLPSEDMVSAVVALLLMLAIALMFLNVAVMAWRDGDVVASICLGVLSALMAAINWQTFRLWSGR